MRLRRRTIEWRGPAFALALTAAVYAPTLWSYFQKDDWGHLLRVSMGLDPWAFGPWFYRPLFLVAFGGMYHTFGLNSMLWHAATLCIHLANVALVYWFARRMRLSATASAIGAALFGVYPTNPEAVSWLSACSGTMAALCGLVAAHIAISTRVNAFIRGLLCAAVWFIGLFCKEDLAALIVILPFLPLFAGKRQEDASGQKASRSIFAGSILPVAFSCAMLAVALFVFQRLESSCDQIYGNPSATIDIPLLRHAVKFALFGMQDVPLHLASTYTGAALVAIVPIMVWKRCPDLRLGMLWFFGTSLALGLVAGYLSPTDRYYYLPSIGVALFVAALTDRLRTRQVGPSFGSWFVLAAFAFALASTQWPNAGIAVTAVLAVWYWLDSTPSDKRDNACLWMVACSLAVRAGDAVCYQLGWGFAPSWMWLTAPVALTGHVCAQSEGRGARPGGVVRLHRVLARPAYVCVADGRPAGDRGLPQGAGHSREATRDSR